MNNLNSELSGVGEREREMNAFPSKLIVCYVSRSGIPSKSTRLNITSHLGNSLNINKTTHWKYGFQIERLYL
jgi:hypothetical protein